MNHVITVKDILIPALVIIGAIIVIGGIFFVLSIIAEGYKH